MKVLANEKNSMHPISTKRKRKGKKRKRRALVYTPLLWQVFDWVMADLWCLCKFDDLNSSVHAGLYLYSGTETKLVVDTSRGERLRVNVSITKPLT